MRPSSDEPDGQQNLLYPVLTPDQPMCPQPITSSGVAVSSRHPLDADKVRAQGTLAENVLKTSEEDLPHQWRKATNACGNNTPLSSSENYQRRVENMSWRVWMGEHVRGESPIIVSQELLDSTDPTRGPPPASWASLHPSSEHPAKHAQSSDAGGSRKWAMAIHGGAGAITDKTTIGERRQAFEEILKSGIRMLRDGMTAFEVVEEVVTLLEECKYFNAGHGSVLTSKETFEMDAAIMDGSTLMGGGCAGTSIVRNPVRLARVVAEKTPHVLIVGPAADDLAKEHGLETVDSSFFLVPERLEQLKRAKQKGIISLDHGGECGATEVKAAYTRFKHRPMASPSSPRTQKDTGTLPTAADANVPDVAAEDPRPLGFCEEDKFGTVGCVVKDIYGNVASAGSTGGLCNKHPGRVGDTAVIGAGVYASNDTAAVACTGKGEVFITHVVAQAVTQRMEMLNESVDEALREVILNRLPEKTGGAIAVDRFGTLAASYNTLGMFTGMADSTGLFQAWDRYR